MQSSDSSSSTSFNPLLATIDINRDGHLFDSPTQISSSSSSSSSAERTSTSDDASNRSNSTDSDTVTSVSGNGILLRPAIPRVLIPLLLSFLSVKLLSSRIAVTSRRGYASCLEYGQSLQSYWNNRMRDDPYDDRTIREDEQLNFGRGTLPLTCFPRQLEMVDMSCALPVSVFRAMVRSRMRVLIVGIDIGYQPTSETCHLLADSIPSLCGLSIDPHFTSPNFDGIKALPAGIRYATIAASTAVGLEAMIRALVATSAKTLNRLTLTRQRTLTMQTFDNQYNFSSTIMELIVKFINLRYFESTFSDVQKFPPQILRQLSMLTHIKQPTLRSSVEEVRKFHQELTTAESQTQTLQLREVGVFYLGAMRTQLVEPMSRMSSSLTTLTPQRWRTSEVVWLKSFHELKNLKIDCSTIEQEYRSQQSQSSSTSSENIQIKPDVLTSTLIQLTQLQCLHIRDIDIDDRQFRRLMMALTSLCDLSICSRAITSIACLSESNHHHLTHTLRILELQIPIPPSEVVHLQSLTRLMTLIVVPPNMPPKSFFSKVPFTLVSSDKAKAFWQRFPLFFKALPQK